MVKNKVRTYDCIHRIVCKYSKYTATCNSTCPYYKNAYGRKKLYQPTKERMAENE